MQIDPGELRQYYASLPDESLLAVEREELTELALQVYEEELADRNLTQPDFETGGEPPTDTEEPDWLGGAGCACTFATGHQGDQAAADAEQGRLVLEAAGIPCHVVTHTAGDDPKPRYEYRLMVPGKLHMQAASVLDKEIFNVEVEAEWRLYFDSLSDEELREVDSEDLFAGLQDRIDRATSAYREALAARGIRSH